MFFFLVCIMKKVYFCALFLYKVYYVDYTLIKIK